VTLSYLHRSGVPKRGLLIQEGRGRESPALIASRMAGWRGQMPAQVATGPFRIWDGGLEWPRCRFPAAIG